MIAMYAGMLTVVLVYQVMVDPTGTSLETAQMRSSSCKQELVEALETATRAVSEAEGCGSRVARLRRAAEVAEDKMADLEDEAGRLREVADARAEEIRAMREAADLLQEAVDKADRDRDAAQRALDEAQAAAEAVGRGAPPASVGGDMDMGVGGLVGVSGQAAVALPIGLPVGKDGKMVLPKTAKRVWFDVGAHREAMYTLPFAKKQKDLLVFAFEPLYKMWAELTIDNAHPRVVTLPVAVSSDPGVGTFHMAGTDQCSSLKKVDPETDIFDWPGGCAETTHSYKVPIVSLEQVLDALPLPTVQFIKVDAQGADYEVIVSAGRALSKMVENVVVEVQTDVPLYSGSKNESDYVSFMESQGFELAKRMAQGPHEINLLFHNTGLGIPLEESDWDLLPLNIIFDGAYDARVKAGILPTKKGSLKVKDRDTTTSK